MTTTNPIGKKRLVLVGYVLLLFTALLTQGFVEIGLDEDSDTVADEFDKCAETGEGDLVAQAHGCSCVQLAAPGCDAAYPDAPCCLPTQGCEEYVTSSGAKIPRCCSGDDCQGQVVVEAAITEEEYADSVRDSVCAQITQADPSPAPYSSSVELGPCCPHPVIVSPSLIFTGDIVQFSLGCIEVIANNDYLANANTPTEDTTQESYSGAVSDGTQPDFTPPGVLYSSCADNDFPGLSYIGEELMMDTPGYMQGHVSYEDTDGPGTFTDHCANMFEVVEYSCDGNGQPQSAIVSCDYACLYETGSCVRDLEGLYQHVYEERCTLDTDCTGSQVCNNKQICSTACTSGDSTCDTSNTPHTNPSDGGSAQCVNDACEWTYGPQPGEELPDGSIFCLDTPDCPPTQGSDGYQCIDNVCTWVIG